MRESTVDFFKLAPGVALAIKSKNISANSMGIDHATSQRIYRLMRNERFSGNLFFYVCKKICEKVISKELRAGLEFEEQLGKKYFTIEMILEKFEFEKDEDILFCAIQGAIMQSGDIVGMKCLDIVIKLYASVSNQE